MQPFLFLWLISSTVGSAKAGAGARQRYFDVVCQPKPRRWPCFLVSLLVHTVALLVLPWVMRAIVPIDEPDFWTRHLRWERALRLRIPERLYLASGGPREAETPRRSSGAPGARSAAKPRASQTAALRKARPSGGQRRRFVLPDLTRRSDHPQSIFQPELPPDLPLQASIRLPELFFWAPKPPVPFRPKVFVLPGYTSPPDAPARLDAPPRLELPTEAPALPFLRMPGLSEVEEAGAAMAAARLPLGPPTPQQPAPVLRGATADTSSGDPVTVLSLSSLPRPLREILVIPPANQLGALAQGAGGPGAPQGRSAPSPQAAPPQAAEPGQASAQALVGPDPPEVPAPLPEPAGHPALLAPETPAAVPAPPPASGASLLAAATRLEHPVGGVFDVVVQSSDADGFPESAGVLTGKPVYSVYVNAGGPKEWIMQYCIPGGEAPDVEVSGGVVRLGGSSPLVAPYPRVTYRPPLKRRPGASYVMIHGFLETRGRFDGLRGLGLSGAEDGPLIIPILEQWEFRPATRDGRPVRVEILLAIPAE